VTAVTRVRLLLALAQALSLGALTAAVGTLLLGRPAPLAPSSAVSALALAVGTLTGADPGRARRRAALAAAAWAAAAAVLLATAALPAALAVLWPLVGLVGLAAGRAVAAVEAEDQGRAVGVQAILLALAAVVLGAFAGRGPLPGPALLGLFSLACAGVVHSLARALMRGVDLARVGRFAAAAVAALAAVAVALAVGPVHDALAVALGALWEVVALALATAMALGAYAVDALVRLLLALTGAHPHALRLSLPRRPPPAPPSGRAPQHAAAPAWIGHLAPMLLVLLAAAAAYALAARALRPGLSADAPPYRDEVLPPERVAGPGGRRRPPSHPLARAYAEALGVLVRGGEAPLPSDTPSRIRARLAARLGEGSEAYRLFARLTEAYTAWRYAGRGGRPPDPPARLLGALRLALRPPGGRSRRPPP
jgi:hypothetical protein